MQIVHADPRRLLARIDHPMLQCHVLSMHAPQSGRPLSERTQWWADTQEIANTHCRNIPLIVLIDANAKSGPHRPPIVFDKDDVCSANTNLFLDFLHAQELCLPCTSQSHTGPTATWTSPDGMHDHRIDYVAIPQTWCSSCVHSCVLQDLDPGNAHEDHQAVGLQLCWQEDIAVQPARAKGASFQRTAIGPNRQHIACAEIKPAPWSTDIETQV